MGQNLLGTFLGMITSLKAFSTSSLGLFKGVASTRSFFSFRGLLKKRFLFEGVAF